MTLTIGDPGLAPGEYRGSVVFITNAPKPRQVTVDVTLTVALPGLVGRDLRTGRRRPQPRAGARRDPQGSRSPVSTSRSTASGTARRSTSAQRLRPTATYTLIGPSGTWPLEFAKDGYVGLTRNEIVTAGDDTDRCRRAAPQVAAARDRRVGAAHVHAHPGPGRPRRRSSSPTPTISTTTVTSISRSTSAK